jgi:hypothetical protein
MKGARPISARIEQSKTNTDMNTVSPGFSQILAQQAAAGSVAMPGNANPSVTLMIYATA